MMDHFGIGQAVGGMLRVYFQSSRLTGRTTSLVESAKDGDRIVFADSREAKRVERLCKDRGAKVECIVVDPLSPQRLLERGPSVGRTILDHGWVEQFYVDAAEGNRRFIDRLERETSGPGAAHEETRHKAKEMLRWEG